MTSNRPQTRINQSGKMVRLRKFSAIGGERIILEGSVERLRGLFAIFRREFSRRGTEAQSF
jgi:hypothetical protein